MQTDTDRTDPRARALASLEEMTPEEAAAIEAGIAADPDSPELTGEDFARMRPAEEVVPEIVQAYRRARGRPKGSTKTLISLRLDQDVIAHFRATGPGWQARINEALRRAMTGE